MLLAILFLGTGASLEGIREAREWEHAGDVAMAGELLPEAYHYYRKVAVTFPETRLGHRALAWAEYTRSRLTKPSRSPNSENPSSWLGEVVDFFTWP